MTEERKPLRLGDKRAWGETTCGFGLTTSECNKTATRHFRWLLEHAAYIHSRDDRYCRTLDDLAIRRKFCRYCAEVLDEAEAAILANLAERLRSPEVVEAVARVLLSHEWATAALGAAAEALGVEA